MSKALDHFLNGKLEIDILQSFFYSNLSGESVLLPGSLGEGRRTEVVEKNAQAGQDESGWVVSVARTPNSEDGIRGIRGADLMPE